MDRQILEDMLEQGDDNALLRYTLGCLCYKEALYEAAAEHLEQALAFDAEHSASWKFYAQALAKLERTGEAASAYLKGIAVAESKGDVQAAKEMRIFLKRLE
jgi:uncharacterized protein HemY